MDDWFQILYNYWYRIISTHISLLWTKQIISSYQGEHIVWPNINLNKVGSYGQMLSTKK